MSNILVRKGPNIAESVEPAVTGGSSTAIMPGGQIFFSGPAGYQIPIGGGRSKGNITPSQRDLTRLSRDRPAIGNIKVMKPEQRAVLNRPTAPVDSVGVIRDMGRRNELARGAKRDKLARLLGRGLAGYAALASSDSDDLMDAGGRMYGTYAATRAATGEGALEGSYDQDEEGNITRTPSAFERGFGDLREGAQETGGAIGRGLVGVKDWAKEKWSQLKNKWPTRESVAVEPSMYERIDAMPHPAQTLSGGYFDPRMRALVSDDSQLAVDAVARRQAKQQRQNQINTQKIGEVLVNPTMTGQAPPPPVGMATVGMNMPPPTQATGFNPQAVGQGEVGTEPVMNTTPTDPKQGTLDPWLNNPNQQPNAVGGGPEDPFKDLKGEPMDMAWSLLKENQPCKDCGQPAPTNFRMPIWELNGLCFDCIDRRMKEMGATQEANEETGQPATTMRDLLNAKISEAGIAGDRQREDLA